MSNSFWNFLTALVPGTLARAEDVNSNLAGIEDGFDSVETITDQAIKVTSSPGTVAIVLNAAARANKLLEFDANGDIAATTIMGDWKGAHADAAGTDYQIRDVVKDAAGAISVGNLYICTATHTSTGDLATDIANWDLLIDVSSLVDAGTLDGLDSLQFLRSDTDDTFTGALTLAGNLAASGATADVINAESTAANGTAVSAYSNVATRTVPLMEIINDNATGSGDALMIKQDQGGDAIDITHGGGAASSALRASVTSQARGIWVSDDGSSTGGFLLIVYSDNASRTLAVASIQQDHASSSAVALTVGQDGTAPNIDLTGKGQIRFPATAVPSTDANTLDDYEEGTWTPEIWDASNSGSESQTYGVQAGRYTKIGRMVHLHGQIQMTSLGTLTGANDARIGNLPFSVSIVGSEGTCPGIVIPRQGIDVTANDHISVRAAGTNYLALTTVALGTIPQVNQDMTITELSADGHFEFSCTYYTTQ